MKIYLQVLAVTMKNNFVREFIYRSNAIAMTVADMVWVVIEYAFFEIIYSNTANINGWTKEQVFFFLGIFISSDALFTTFFQRSFWNFPNLISQGDLDILLTKPVSPIFLATFIAVLSSATIPSLPGVTGTPALRAHVRAMSLSPIFWITSAGGPINLILQLSTTSAKCAFSARNP